MWINKCKCVCLCMISPWVQQTLQFTSLVLEISLIRSHLLWGEFSAFSAANTIHNVQCFIPPGTNHCWVGRGSMEWEVCPTLLHSAVEIEPQTFWRVQRPIHLATCSNTILFIYRTSFIYHMISLNLLYYIKQMFAYWQICQYANICLI